MEKVFMRCEIDIQPDGPVKMLGGMGVMALAIKQDAELIIACSGEDDEAACQALDAAR